MPNCVWNLSLSTKMWEMSSGLSSLIWEDEPGAFHPYLMIVCKILSFTWTIWASGTQCPRVALICLGSHGTSPAPVGSVASVMSEIPQTVARQVSSVHGVLQARILEWLPMPFSRGSSWPRDQNCVSCVSCLAGGLFTHRATRDNSISCTTGRPSESTVILGLCSNLYSDHSS